MEIDDLVTAAEGGDVATIGKAIAEGFALDTLDGFGRTALVVAAQNGHLGAVQQLIAAGATLEAHETTAFVRYYHGAKARPVAGRWTLLHAAAVGGAVDVIEYLLDDHHYAIDARDHGGWTPLHVAAFYPLATLATLDCLLARGADPNAEDALGQNAAAHARDLPVLERLLDAGAHVDGGDLVATDPLDMRGEQARGPLDRFVEKHDAAAVALLLDRGAAVTGTAITFATMFDPDILAALLARDVSDDALAYAIGAAHDDAAFDALLARIRVVPPGVLLAATTPRRLAAVLARGVDPNAARDAAGKTPLLLAAERGDRALVDALVAARADVQAVDATGRTALHAAAARGDLPLVEALVAAGADPQAVDKSGKTPRALAFANEQFEPVRRFLEPLTRPRAAPPAARPAAIAAGARVRHATLGTGVVVRVNGDKVTVRFDGGEKIVVARVLALEP